ncbi:putative methyltransferase-like protein 7A [Rhipicephalus sanguineus]|uniref:putative methyltransferase-like protein 7A n=1 Tax=Rhipicephalus sanguineus TaxID=34632 RepID=UPI001895E479|nr:putative methyltransferase-like protein 7A [Rhipicephalus sanguineus]
MMFRVSLLTLASYLTVAMVLPTALLLLALQRSHCCRKLFANWVFYPLLNPLIRHAFEGIRREILYELNDLVSHDPELRREDAIRVLEVNVGSGRNFDHIFRNIRYVAVDRTSTARSTFLRRQSQYEHIVLEQWLLTSGEDLAQVPDNHVDAVIATHVLCSVNDVRKLVSECRRVLAPGGKLLFMEHVACPRDSWIYQLQLFLDPLWQLLTCGCHLGRDTSAAIIEAGFREVCLKEVYLPILALISRQVYGVATKSGAPGSVYRMNRRTPPPLLARPARTAQSKSAVSEELPSAGPEAGPLAATVPSTA